MCTCAVEHSALQSSPLLYAGEKSQEASTMCYYHSLVKECPSSKDRPPLSFGPISCIGVKAYLHDHPPWSELMERTCGVLEA